MAVRSEKNGAVTTIILDRPTVKNAVDGATALALESAVLDFEADPTAKVAVLFGDHGCFFAPVPI